ncbi:hypothetical protein [Burkholderia glumae]
MTSFLRWKPFSQVSNGPKITGQVTTTACAAAFARGTAVCESAIDGLTATVIVVQSTFRRHQTFFDCI